MPLNIIKVEFYYLVFPVQEIFNIIEFCKEDGLKERLSNRRKPIPIWAHIATWDKKESINKWIASITYNSLPKNSTKLYLLDGLDEIFGRKYKYNSEI